MTYRVSDLGPKIGKGRTADVFGLDENRVVKLFHRDINESEVQDEMGFAKLAVASDLPTAEVLERIEVEGRIGVVFRRISGESLLARISRRPHELPSLARQFARLHCRMHVIETPSRPSFRDNLEAQIRKVANFGAAKKDRIIAHMDSLPAPRMVLCHGDYHPENVIVSGRGLVIIDWATARSGCAAADCARTALLTALGSISHLNPPARLIVALVRGTFQRIYRWQYLRTMALGQRDIDQWVRVVAAARLAEEIEGETEPLTRLVERFFSC